jgi:hypothetical protein
MKYSFITQHKNTYPISLQCQVLGVNRSGYYHYRANVANKVNDPEHQEMVEWVKAIAASSDYSYGSRRMKKALNILGYPVNRNQARKLMCEAGVQARQRKKFKVTTNSNHQQPVFDNLLQRQFDVPQTDRVYASDVTYIWTQEGWLYLAVVIDLCSRKVVGWSMSSRMKAQLVCDALTMAIWQRRPKAGLVHHSDRGSQRGFKESSQHYSRREHRYSSSASAGVFHPSVLRGRPFSAEATASSSSGECLARSVPLGKYWRSRPFVFSLVPRCHGLCGSQKKTASPISIRS